MATWRSTTFAERIKDQRSPVESFGADESRAERTYDVEWTQRQQAVLDFLGYPQLVYNGGYPFISRVTPHYHPEWDARSDDINPNQPWLYATRVASIEGVGAPRDSRDFKSTADVARYGFARMRVVYESLTYDVISDADMGALGYVDEHTNPDESTLRRFVTKLTRPNANYLSAPIGLMKFVLANAPAVPERPGKIVPNFDISWRWHQIPQDAIPTIHHNLKLTSLGALDLALGTVNSYKFAGYDPGTLLLTGADIIPIRAPTGKRLFDIEYKVKWFKEGFHKAFYFLDASNLRWIEISVDGATHAITEAGKHIFDGSDFKLLFRCPA